MAKKLINLYSNNFLAFTIYNLLKILFLFNNKPTNKKEILIVNFGQIGDLIITSRLFDFSEKHRIENISILINEKFCAFFRYLAPTVDIIGVDLQKYNLSFIYRFNKLSLLRKTSYKTVLNLNSFNRIMTDEIVLLQNACQYYCLENNWKNLKPIFRNNMLSQYTNVLICKGRNEYYRHLEVFEKFFDIQLNFSPLITKAKKNENLNFDKYIVISPTTSQKISAWHINSFIELIKLLPRDINVVVLGDKTTIELDNLCMLSNFVNLINKTTIEEAADIIKNSKLYIGNDSGLTHVALKFDIPFICILGGGAFGYYFPVFESERTKYIYKKLECFNCDWYCKFNEPKCLTQISVDEVNKEAINMLNKYYV